MGNPITIKDLSRELGNTGWTVYTRVPIEHYMEDFDNYQFQPNQPHDVADDTVAQTGSENRASHNSDDILHIMNNREWIEEQKGKLVEIDRQERRRGKNFMKRVKLDGIRSTQQVEEPCKTLLIMQKDSKRKNGEEQLD